MSTGFVLNITQEMLGRLDLADQKIERLAITSENARNRIIASFQQINTQGIDAFINKLNEAQSRLTQLGNVPINIGANAGAFSSLTSQAQKAIDEVNRVVSTISKVKKVSGETGMAKNPFAGITDSLGAWNSLQAKIDEADQKIKKLTSTTMDYERQLERLRSGKQTTATVSTNEYAYAKENIAALQEEKRIYREKQEEITRQNNALAEQVRIQNSLKQFVANQNSLPEQRKRQEYEAMRQMYIEDEKASAAAEKKKLKDAEEAEKKRQKLREQRIKEEEKAAERERKAYERMYKQLPSTITTKQAGQLVAQSMNANSINQRQVAIKNLQAARNNLDATDKRYDQTVRKLNTEIQRQREELKRLGVESDKVKNSHRGLMDISGQLARRLALVFSVYQVAGYVKKLIEVRGEFELQQRALQAIIQNKDKANEIWDQTVELAMKSPFRVKDLVSYTKQLAAYRIESDKLFETNKRLADISAGLGVDMQRLILAYGQVRSASYLRATEVRQFTEAGIPLLEQLAKYFTELEGHAVSVGNVFERISKRMVSFADVEEIFKRMTSAGGTFYRMQEIQAETLRGQVSNLKDSVDLMLNDIGKANDGVIKNSVAFVRTLVNNWETVAGVLKAIIAAFVAVKIHSALTSVKMLELAASMKVVTIAETEQLTVTQLLKVGYLSLMKTIKATGAAMKTFLIKNPYTAAILAATVAVWKLVSANNAHKESLEAINKEFEERGERIREIYLGFSKNIRFAGIDEYAERSRKSLQELINLANDEYAMNIEVNLQELNKDELRDYFINLRQAMNEANAFASNYVSEIQKSTEWTATADIVESGAKLSSAATTYMTFLQNAAKKAEEALLDYKDRVYDLPENMFEAYEKFSMPQQERENDLEYLERLAKGFAILREEAKKLRKEKGEDAFKEFIEKFFTETKVGIFSLTEQSDFTFWALDFKKQYEDFIKNVHVSSKMTDEEKRIYFTVAINKAQSQYGWNEFVRNYIEKWTEERFEFQFVPVLATPKTLEPWAERVTEAITEVNNKIKEKSPAIKDIDLFPLPKIGQTKEAYLNLAKGVIEIAEMTYNATQKIEDQYMVDRTKALAPYADEVKKILNLFKEKKTTGGDKRMQELKNQISLIKEMNSEYEKLIENMTEEEAKLEVINSYRESLKAVGLEKLGFNIEEMDFTDLGTIDSLEKLLGEPKYKANKYAMEIQKALDNIRVELKVEAKIKKREELAKDIEELFDRLELTKELKKLGIGKELGEELFKFETIDTKGVRATLEALKPQFEALGKDGVKEYEDALKKINDIEDKDTKERMKTYTKYLLEGMNERVKLKIEELRKLKEIEESKEFTPEQKERIKKGVSEEARKEQQKQEWKDFKESDMYTMMFEDLEHYGTEAINMLYTKLSDLKKSLTELPANEVKEIVQQIEKLENIKIERNPFKELVKYSREVKKIGFSEEELQGQLRGLQEREAYAQRIIDVIHLMEQAQTDGMSQADALAQLTPEQVRDWQVAVDLQKQLGGEMGDVVKNQENIVKRSKESQVIVKGQISSYKRLSKAQEESFSKIETWLQSVDDLFSSAKELMTALGVESDSVAMTIADTGSSMVSLILSAVQFTAQMQLLGVASNMALGVIGWIAIALQAVATLLTAIFSAKDNQLKKQVEAHQRTVENLLESYEELEKKIDEAWNVEAIRQYNSEMQQTMSLAMNAQKAAIAAQEQRKGANKEGSENWEELQDMKDELKDMEEQLAESLEESFSKITDGILDDVHGAAKEFTDAWYEAFKETGDGLSGLEENFTEMFLSLAKNQAAMQITGAFVDEWKRDLKQYLNDTDTRLTPEEARAWADEVKATMPELSAALEAFLGTIHEGLDGGASGLSALQKGISGMSEQQAEILTAYWNSVRGYTASIDSKMDLVLKNINVSTENNPILDQLVSQTNILTKIHGLLEDVASNSPRTFKTSIS